MKSLFLSLVFLAGVANAQAVKAGAGCIATDGRLITFLDCGAISSGKPELAASNDLPSPIDLPSEQPAELAPLLAFIDSSPTLTSTAKQSFKAALAFDSHRKYFSVRPNALTPTSEKRILFQFTRVVGLPTNQMKLYAVTDTNAHYTYLPDPGKVTYLLPGYYALKTPQERMAALIHEAWWVLHPGSTDEDGATKIEAAFQALLDDPQNPAAALKLNQLLYADDVARSTDYRDQLFGEDTAIDHQLALKIDFQSGALKNIVNDQNQISSYTLFGGLSTIQCFNAGADLDSCYVAFMINLSSLRQASPHSFFLALIADQAKQLHAAGKDGFLFDLFLGLEGNGYYSIASEQSRESCTLGGLLGCSSVKTRDPYPLYSQLYVPVKIPTQYYGDYTRTNVPTAEIMIQLTATAPDHFIMTAVAPSAKGGRK